MAAAAASATAWSCSPVPPLTPTAPTTAPPRRSGTPPAKTITRPPFDTWMPKNWPPLWECSARSLVAMSNARDVYALLIEMSMLPIHAPSIRACATRLPPASTTAMFIGWPISAALASPASMTRRACASVTLTVSSLSRPGGV